MRPSSRSFWLKLPLPLKLVSAITSLDEIGAEAFDANVIAPMQDRWHDTRERIKAFEADVGSVASLVGGRNALMAFGLEYAKNRSENVARLDGLLEVVSSAAERLVERVGDTEVDDDLRDAGGALQTLLGTLDGELTYAQAYHVTNGVLALLRMRARLLRGNGFPDHLVARIAAGWAAVDADNRELAQNTVAQQLATQQVHATVGRIVDFLVEYNGRLETMALDGHARIGASYAEAKAWHQTRSSEVQARREAAQADEEVAPASGVPASVQAVVSAFQQSTPVHDEG